jgi:hypothetical protein
MALTAKGAKGEGLGLAARFLGGKGVIRRARHLHVQAKRAERLRLRDAMAQAERSTKVPEDRSMPVVILCQSRRATDQSFAIARLADVPRGLHAAAQALRPLRVVLCGEFVVVHAFLASGDDGVTDHGVTRGRIGHRIFLVQLVVKCGCVFARQLAQRTPYSVKEVDVDPAPTQVAGAISMGEECM